MIGDRERWWDTYFDEVFLRVYRPLLDFDRTASELDAIEELLGLPAMARVLDLGCGWGRHAVPLAQRGYEVVGYDLSDYLLREAQQVARGLELGVHWVRGDMRHLPLVDGFDAALSLFSSLGYFGNDNDDAQVLRGLREAVRAGGSLVVESMHRDLIAREYAERDWWETPDGEMVWVDREFDPVEGVSREVLHWRDSDGNEATKHHCIRVRSATEWKHLLEETGWEPLEWFGDWNLEPFTHQSERLVVLCRRK